MLKKTIILLQEQLREKKTFNKQAMAKEGHAQARAQLSREKYELCQVELQTTKSLLFELRAKYARVTRGEGDRCNGKGRQAKQIIEATKGLEAMMLKRRMQRQQQQGGGGGGRGGRGGRKKGSQKGTTTTTGGSGSRIGRPPPISSKSIAEETDATSSGSGSGGGSGGGEICLGGISRDSLRLNQALRSAAERLHEIVCLKNALDKSDHQRKHYESLYRRQKGGMVERENQKTNQLQMANRALRAESMAAWMEQQLLEQLSNGKKPDYTYHPEIDISPMLEGVLKENNWLMSGDYIASGYGEKSLAKLAGRETPLLSHG